MGIFIFLHFHERGAGERVAFSRWVFLSSSKFAIFKKIITFLLSFSVTAYENGGGMKFTIIWKTPPTTN